MSTIEIIQQALDIVSDSVYNTSRDCYGEIRASSSPQNGNETVADGIAAVSSHLRQTQSAFPDYGYFHHRSRPIPVSVPVSVHDRSTSPPHLRSQASRTDFEDRHHSVPDHEDDLDNHHDSNSSLVVDDIQDEDEINNFDGDSEDDEGIHNRGSRRDTMSQ
jgi:hypothetical protein